MFVGTAKLLDKEYNRSYTAIMKTAISIPDKVFRSAEGLAKRLGVSRSQLYSTAISEYLSRHHGKEVTEQLDSIYFEVNSSLSPGLALLQSKSLAQEEW